MCQLPTSLLRTRRRSLHLKYRSNRSADSLNDKITFQTLISGGLFGSGSSASAACSGSGNDGWSVGSDPTAR